MASLVTEVVKKREKKLKGDPAPKQTKLAAKSKTLMSKKSTLKTAPAFPSHTLPSPPPRKQKVSPSSGARVRKSAKAVSTKDLNPGDVARLKNELRDLVSRHATLTLDDEHHVIARSTGMNMCCYPVKFVRLLTKGLELNEAKSKTVEDLITALKKKPEEV